jgi:hypothetical protein
MTMGCHFLCFCSYILIYKMAHLEHSTQPVCNAIVSDFYFGGDRLNVCDEHGHRVEDGNYCYLCRTEGKLVTVARHPGSRR